MIIDIVMAADCLDAATDTIGRSCSQGKTFDMYRKEVEEGAGIVKPEGMPGGYIVSAWKRARADVQGNIPPAEKNAV